jgi:hypothetical protein
VTCGEVENCPEPSNVKEKPVIAPEAMGETAMLPIMSRMGTAEMPVFASTA